MLWARNPAAMGAAQAETPVGRGPPGSARGSISDLGNPKIAVFFTSFLPQFVG